MQRFSGITTLFPFLPAAPVVAVSVAMLWQDGDLAAQAAALLLAGCAGYATIVTGLRASRASRDRAAEEARAAFGADLVDLLLDKPDATVTTWLWETDADGRLQNVSERLAIVAGIPADALAGKPLTSLFVGGCGAADTLIADRVPFHAALVERWREGGASAFWHLTGKPVRDRRGRFLGYSGAGRDVTLVHTAEMRIAHLANDDALTGLANRDCLRRLATTACAAAALDARPRALVMVEISGFRPINDNFGHAAGDTVLRTVAARLKACVPSAATVARLGGCEFAILYLPAHASSAETLGRAIVNALRAPFDIDGAEMTVGVSVGVAVTPDHAADSASLAQKADLALQRAKSEGGVRVHLFRPEDEQARLKQRGFETDLKLALARREFELHYQPLLDLADGTVVSCEALIRWRSETRGMVSPLEFIPAAETGGLIVAIGRWVLQRACADAATWPGCVRVAVNISPQHFRTPDFVADVLSAIRASGLPPTRLEIEITEGVFLDTTNAAMDNLNALRQRGITIALDDFGTGFSSLNYLTRFPVDKIKIDRSFVSDFVDRPENRAIVDAILTLARKLSIRVTAEGVETLEQALALKLRRCDDIQGYLISRPRPGDEIVPLLETLPGTLRVQIPTLFESALAAVLAMKRRAG